jgi:hypothetical protein
MEEGVYASLCSHGQK